MATFEIPLDIPDVEIEKVEITENGDIIDHGSEHS
jgi:hypothetical protein